MQNNVVPAILTLAPGSGSGTMNGQQIAQPVLPGAAAPMDFAALMQTQPATGTAAGAASGPTPVGLPPVSPDTLVGEGGEAAELSPEALAALAATTGAAAGNISSVIATKSGPVALSDFAEGDEDPDLLAALQAEEVTTPAASLATAQQMKERQSLRAPTVKPAEAGTSTEGAAATLMRNAEMLTTGDGQQATADADATQVVTATTDKVTKATETAQQATAPGVQQHTAGDATPAGTAQKAQLLNSTAPLPQTQQPTAPEATPTGESKPTLAQMAPYSMTQINAPKTQAQDGPEAAPTVAEMEAKLKAEILSTSQEQGKGAAKQIDPSTAAAIKSVAAPALENAKTTSEKAAPVIARAAAAADATPQETGTAEDTLTTKVAELPTQANAFGLRGRLAQAQAPAQADASTQPAPQTLAQGQGQTQGQGQGQAQQQAAPLPGATPQTASANDAAQAQGTAPDAGSKMAYDTTKVQPDLKAELTAEMKPGVAQMSPAQTAAQSAAVAPQQAMMAGAEASAQTQATQALAQSNVTAQAEAAQPQTATSQGAPMTRSLMMTDREWPTQLTAMVKEARDLTQGDIEIALQPERLGKMTIRMEMRDNAVAVTIVTDNDSSARLLNDNQARLADLMKQAGLDLTQHNASSGQQGREQAGLGGQAGGNPGGHGQSSDTNQPATAQILGGDAGTMNPAAEDDGIDILA
ncbi:Flagellar hook-length control protein FliK [Thalassovita autumnalis]|uniref:Flagellar hook-length control protein FliK n=1 Tax=Thalassovita autumnalis TaxID=2072972 RepID=A0A0P1FSJ0_9RHOB|nr:flagellar hook-length control protein FliK [Thalassovita autumnalis]CUH64569.1 Flagellar hook-length control protein FliK [Thalassovita autumnalis]CUH71602.1 Flagellar hook-length control protein FliK [Thalassovita autumnalis]